MTNLPQVPTDPKYLGQERKHPAKFSNGFIQIFREMLNVHLQLPWTYDTPLVLDPFAGVGTIHELRPEFATFGVEIEPEWAAMSEFTYNGDSTSLPEYWTNMFQAVVTSVTYGNRMADHHELGKCTTCDGKGYNNAPLSSQLTGTQVDHQCNKCLGTGKESSKRNTYKHVIGHDLNPRNTGMYQFTQQKYKNLHETAYVECWRVLEPGGIFILNCSDHIRQGKVMPVSAWHRSVLQAQGFKHIKTQDVNTQRLGFGANGSQRVDSEQIMIFRKEP